MTETCACGCGEATRTKGARFLKNHHKRKAPFPYLREDRGYTTPCWVWQWNINPDGYGMAWVNGRNMGAHRLYYQRTNGAVPHGLHLDHLCRVRCCVNPDHMEPVTSGENLRRGSLAKLTPAAVRAIRSEYAKGRTTQDRIAVQYGVTQATVWRALRGVSWKDAV